MNVDGMTGVNVLLMQANIGQIHSFLFLIFPGHVEHA